MNLWKFLVLSLLFTASCEKGPSLDSPEINAIKILKNSIENHGRTKEFVDVRKLVSPSKIKSSKIPLLYVELASGQNALLARYPGEGNGTTWLGADGSTVTFKNGVLKATRGLGYDLMGSTNNMPKWDNIKNGEKYKLTFAYLRGNNSIKIYEYICSMEKSTKEKQINIFNDLLDTVEFKEKCKHGIKEITNKYYLNKNGSVVKSKVFHSDKIGYILTELSND
tara:strand:+ start:615 stop:1283 length:669 start_codon:yes stop_codon:yes gene_type:complete